MNGRGNFFLEFCKTQNFAVARAKLRLASNVSRICAVAEKADWVLSAKIMFLRELTIWSYRKLSDRVNALLSNRRVWLNFFAFYVFCQIWILKIISLKSGDFKKDKDFPLKFWRRITKEILHQFSAKQILIFSTQKNASWKR